MRRLIFSDPGGGVPIADLPWIEFRASQRADDLPERIA